MREKLADEFAKRFVAAKRGKMSCCVRFYNWLNNTFVQKIMFKNKPAELEQLKKEHAQGRTEIPTELENIMLAEAKEMLRDRLENLEGRLQLHEFCRKRSR